MNTQLNNQEQQTINSNHALTTTGLFALEGHNPNKRPGTDNYDENPAPNKKLRKE